MNQSALLHYDNVSQISKKNYHWKLRARVLSVWNVPEHMLPKSPSSMDMVLIDNKGMKFEASLCKSHPFCPKIVEGRVYQISFFRIVDNIGAKRLTSTEYRLFLHSCTKIVPAVDDDIPLNRWEFFNMDQIKYYGNTFGYLVDVIGILSAASSEKLLIKDNRVYKTMDIQLLDKSGMSTCVLVGDIVDMISQYLCSDWLERPIVGLCYVEVRKKDDDIVMHVVPYVTRILINHKFQEDFVLANRFDGINSKLPVEYLPKLDKNVDIHADMLELHPKKTIPQLLLSREGIFVVHAWIVGLLKECEWSYSSCRCYTELERGNDVYRCNRCFRTIEKFINRYSFKLEVYDGVDTTIFVLNDCEARELINIPCEELMNSPEAKIFGEYPSILEDKLVGKELLFKVRAGFGITYKLQKVYEVLRICDDSEIIKMFKSEKLFITPVKDKFVPPFMKLEDAHENSKAGEKHVSNLICNGAAAGKHNLRLKSCAIGCQISTAAIAHRSLKRKLQGEFDAVHSAIADELKNIEPVVGNKLKAKYVGNIECQGSGVKTAEDFSKMPGSGIAVKNGPESTKTMMNLAEENISASDDVQKLKSASIIDLTQDDEEFEISPTQVGTMTLSFDLADSTNMEKDGEVTSKEVIDLTKVLEDVDVKSTQNDEELEVWEVVDLST